MTLSIKDKLAFVAGKTASQCLAMLKSHGTSLPGLIAHRISLSLLGRLIKITDHEPIYITGTNGKSTTAGFFASMMSEACRPIIHNASGANLISGILSLVI